MEHGLDRSRMDLLSAEMTVDPAVSLSEAEPVEFRGWTPAGELRHAVFKGWHQG